MRARIIALCLGLALVAAVLGAPSRALAQGTRGTPATAAPDRSAAREFVYAAYRLRVAVKAQAPAIEQSAAIARGPACRKALGGASRRQVAAHLDDLVGALVDILTGTLLAPVGPQLAAYQAQLDRIPTTDPVLRSGRAAWRSSMVLYAQVRPLPSDLCARLDGWRAAGYARAARPELQPKAVQAVLSGTRTIDRKLDAAVVRLRVLGATAGQARRFAGDTLFDGVVDDDVLGLPDPTS
jgi:hypothetical protein